jgi:hypothetical protein
MKKMVFVLLQFFILGSLGTIAEIHAQRAGETLKVNVMVSNEVRVEFQSQPATLIITAEDIARGYVEVGSATVLKVKSNVRDGYLLHFVIAGGPFTGIQVIDGTRIIELDRSSGFLHMPNEGIEQQEETKYIGYRFILSPDAKPGEYRWPIQLNTNV